MTTAEFRAKWAHLAAAQQADAERLSAIRPVVRDGLAHLGLPASIALSEPIARGRYWFSLWDGWHAPFCKLQRFEA